MGLEINGGTAELMEAWYNPKCLNHLTQHNFVVQASNALDLPWIRSVPEAYGISLWAGNEQKHQ